MFMDMAITCLTRRDAVHFMTGRWLQGIQADCSMPLLPPLMHMSPDDNNKLLWDNHTNGSAGDLQLVHGHGISCLVITGMNLNICL